MIARAIPAFVLIDVTRFGAAGRFDWPQAWLLTAIFAVMFLLGAPWMIRHDPDLVRERLNRRPSNVPPWDRRLLRFYPPLMVALFVTAALDAGRWRWSHVPVAVQMLSTAGILLAIAGIWWCMTVNHFLAAFARVQTDRGHTVVQSGPYRFVRHPMYTSIIVLMLGIALLLGSWLALIPAALIGTLFVVRTWLEDRMLTEGLAGYRAYGQRVPKRLVPGVW